MSYKRLTREIAVPAGGGDLTFWTSYDTEEHWDFLAVEARTAGGSDWTTLPDANGHAAHVPGHGRQLPGGTSVASCTRSSTHYQTLNADGDVLAQRHDGGQWNAASGSSNGWQQWTINLDA